MSNAETQDWLIGEFAARLSSVFEMMTGEAVAIEHASAGSPAAELLASGLTWQQPFSGAAGAVWLHAAETEFAVIGAHVLRAAGVEDADAATTKSTYLETLSQALSGIGQALSAKLKREVTPANGREFAGPPPATQWFRVQMTLPGHVAVMDVGFENALLERLGEKERPDQPPAPPASAGPAPSRTFDILLEVELPVSVSFGRAQVQLKDVLKLTTGSIVELNRSIAEPVEVIVNNCVIARGEVVVVEGNFGVRIQQVISRQERLRTLN